MLANGLAIIVLTCVRFATAASAPRGASHTKGKTVTAGSTIAGGLSRRFAAALTLGLSLGASVFVPAPPASAQGAVKETHGDWQIRCDTPPGALSVARGRQAVIPNWQRPAKKKG